MGGRRGELAVACEECAIARKRPWGVYMTTCSDCRARMLANGPAFFESRKAAKLTPAYRAALALVRTKGETIESAHKRVREWDRRIRGPREAEPVPAQGQASENAATGREMASPGQP